MSWYFGCDSRTGNNPCGTDFYIGTLGYGTTPEPSVPWALPSGSDLPACSYWNLQGPESAPSGKSFTQWGQAQAQAYWNYYSANLLPSGSPLANLFGAISSDSDGWKTGGTADDYSANQQVVEGFLNELANIASIDNHYKQLGLYGSQKGEFEDLLNAENWTSPQPVVIWVADRYSGSNTDCEGVENNYCPMPTLGGYFPMIWQYAQNPDYDVTPYYGFASNGYWTPTLPPGICG